MASGILGGSPVHTTRASARHRPTRWRAYQSSGAELQWGAAYKPVATRHSGKASSHSAYSAWRLAAAAIVSFLCWVWLRRERGTEEETWLQPHICQICIAGAIPLHLQC